MRALHLLSGCLLPIAIVACSAAPTEESGRGSGGVTSVENTSVKNQAIGNCWIYSAAGWAESLHKGATKRDVDLSEGYWTFWYWYEQIVGGDIGNFAAAGESGETVDQAGFWGLTAEIIRRYGFMYEGDFIADPDPNSSRHQVALSAINKSLKEGALKARASRRDPRLVRDELYRAWKLDDGVKADIEGMFGASSDARAEGSEPLAIADRVDKGSLGATRIHAPHELPVIGADGTSIVTLEDVVGTPAAGKRLSDGARVGPEAWTDRRYAWPNDEKGRLRRRAFMKNVQNALNHRLAIPFIWWITNNAQNGVYSGENVTASNVAALHSSILVDYEVENVPGYGTLRVDQRETRPEALEAALDDSATVTFFRIKNSWGDDPGWSEEERRQYGASALEEKGSKKPHYLPGKPGYNDLYVKFLDRSQEIWGDKVNMHMLVQIALPPKLRFEIPPR